MKKYRYSRNVRCKMKHRRHFSIRKALRKAGSEIVKFFLILIAAAAILLMFWYGWGKEIEYQDACLYEFKENERSK